MKNDSNILPFSSHQSVENFDVRLIKRCSYLATAILVPYFIGLHKYLFKLRDGESFYCTRQDQIKGSGMSEWQLKKAEKEALEKGFITKQVKGSPPTSYYTVDFKRIDLFLKEANAPRPRKKPSLVDSVPSSRDEFKFFDVRTKNLKT